MNELQRIEPTSTAVTTNDPESILRYAIDQKADIALVERMMVVRDKLKAEKAKEEFDRALADFQSQCPIIEKRKQVGGSSGFRYKYAPLDHIVTQIRDLLRANGFSYSLNSEIEGDLVKAICTITHSCGHHHISEFKVPVDQKATMNLQQKFGSAMTFAKRYAFCNAFGILTGDEDTDGRTETPKPTVNPLHGTSSAAPSNSEKLMKKALIDATRKIHRIESGYALDLDAISALTQWLVDEALISDTETLGDLAGDRLMRAIEKAKAQSR